MPLMRTRLWPLVALAACIAMVGSASASIASSVRTEMFYAETFGAQGTTEFFYRPARSRTTALASASTALSGDGTMRVAVLLANFSSDTRQPWTKTVVADALFGQSSAAAYWSEVSNGQLSISGEVFGYFTLTTPTGSCDYNSWLNAAESEAASSGVALSSFTNVMLAFPRQTSCGWSALGSVFGPYTWINGALSTYTTAHELGHNIGLHHASSLRCADEGGGAVAYSRNCTANEYGDPYDVMGTGTRHTSSWHRREAGFLGDSDQLTVTAAGRYELAAAAPQGGTPRILRVARPDGYFYYIERRVPFGQFDSFSETGAAVNGLLVRIGPDSGVEQSLLLDMTPSTTTYGDAPLGVGKTFVDTVSQLTITVVSLSPDSATVDVRFSVSDPSPSPSPSVSPSATPQPDVQPPSTPSNLTGRRQNGKAYLTWLASTDDRGPIRYRIFRNGRLLTTVSVTYRAATLVSGRNTFAVKAVDGAGNVSAVSNKVVISGP